MSSKTTLFVLALLALSFAPNIAGSLHEPDEGRYAEIGREMLLENGEFLVPRVGSEAHLTKPPLTYWATALSTRIFGANVFGAKFFVSLANLMILLLVFRIGSDLFGRESGIRACLIFGTGLYGFIVGHFLSTDVFIVLWQALAIFAACRATVNDEPASIAMIFLFWLAFSLSFLTKGPPGLMALVPALLFLRRKGQLRRFLNPLAIAMFLAFSLSWYIYIVIQDPERLRFFLFEEVWQRVASNRHHREHTRWLFVAILAVGACPWFRAQAQLIGNAKDWFRNGRRRLSPEHFLLVTWVASSLVIFFLSRSRMFLYLGPLWVGFAVLLGQARSRAVEKQTRGLGRRQIALIVVWCFAMACAQEYAKSRKLGGDSKRIVEAIEAYPNHQSMRLINGIGKRVYSLAYLTETNDFVQVDKRLGKKNTAPILAVDQLLHKDEMRAFIVVKNRFVAPPLEVLTTTRELSLCLLSRDQSAQEEAARKLESDSRRH